MSLKDKFLEFTRTRSFIIFLITILLIIFIIFSDNNLITLKDILKPGFLSLLIRHSITFTIPIFLAALGGLYAERSGVINLALEGMMLTGAFTAVLMAFFTQNYLIGLIFGIIVGALLGLVHAFISIHLKGDQIISGVAINILALGITNYFYKVMLKDVSGANIPGLPSMNDILDFFINSFFPSLNWENIFKVPPLNYDIVRILGYIFLEQSPILYIAILLGIVGHYILYHTKYGLRIRAVGEHPRAADTLGINVYAVRYACVVISGALAGLAGVYLSMGFLSGTFSKEMSSSRGFIAIAAYIFGNWNVGGTAFASSLFGFFSAVEEFMKIKLVFLNIPIFLPGVGWAKINLLASEFLDMIPYLLTIAVLARSVRKVRAPGAIGQPYEKEMK
ncbi:MAG: ABC transporter permease [Candidatus Hodarchaeales archaeon]